MITSVSVWLSMYVWASVIPQRYRGRVVGLIHAIVQLFFIFAGGSRDHNARFVCSIGTGYFLSEFLYSLVITNDKEGILHGSLCGATYLIIEYLDQASIYRMGFLLMTLEMSTPFLHVAVFLSGFGYKSCARFVFQVFAVVFFIARIIMLPFYIMMYYSVIGRSILILGVPFYMLQIVWLQKIIDRLNA